MVVIGERLGLYKALAGASMSSAELAAKTKTDERYLREWLASQAAGGYITYDSKSDKFSLTEEQVLTMAMVDSPAYLPGDVEIAVRSLSSGSFDHTYLSDRLPYALPNHYISAIYTL